MAVNEGLTETVGLGRVPLTETVRRPTSAPGTLQDDERSRVETARQLFRRAVSVVTPLGWSVVAVGVVAWVAGSALGWEELLYAAATCLVVTAIAGVFMMGRATLRTDIDLDPPRLTAGENASGRLRFTNDRGARTLPLDVELPVGKAQATFRVPSLGPGAEHEELLVIPTERRGVIAVGPATTVRADPLGLMVRRVGTGATTELIVHPRTIPLPSFGAGALRDLEGLTTKEVSASDLAFHSLREYTPGDDMRFLHWRSSAKAGKLQVRQFNDTRRSSLTVLIDSRAEAYGDPEEFETGLSVAGSLVVRAARDGLRANLVTGSQLVMSSAPYLLLDALARAQMRSGAEDLPVLAARALQRSSDTTLAVLISGSAIPASEMRRAALRFPSEVRTAAIRVVPDEHWSVGSEGATTLIQLGELRTLPAVVASGAVT